LLYRQCFSTVLDTEETSLTDDEDYLEASGELVDLQEERLFHFSFADGSGGAVDQYGPGARSDKQINSDKEFLI
jgi:hypothetical protein